MSQQLAMVALLVDDYDAGIAYYVGVLGFTLLEDTRRSDSKRWVRVAPPGATGTELLLAVAVNPRQQASIGNQTGGRVGFFLHSDDFAADHAAMLARGVKFTETPRHEAYGTVAVFEDGYGNRWDLIGPAP